MAGFIETENGQWLPGSGEEGAGVVYWVAVSVWEDETALEMDGGDGCTPL